MGKIRAKISANKVNLIVTTTKSRRNIKIMLFLSVPVGKSWQTWANAKLGFFCFLPDIPFLGKFGPKNQNCLFKVKFDT